MILPEGAVAPNFDLASTEEAMLMLVDEVPRTALVLYFFADPADARVREDLKALHGAREKLRAERARVWAISPTKLEPLKALQRELGIELPLLHDDRGLAKAWGFTAAAEGEPAPAPVLALVGRAVMKGPGEFEPARVLRHWVPAPPVASVLGEILAKLAALPPATASMPDAVLDGFTRWRVNR